MNPNEWAIKPDAPVQGTSDDDFYCLENGYIKPEKVLEDPEQAKQVKESVSLIRSFLDALTEHELRAII